MTTPAIAHRQKIERTIVELIVREAISKGYSISGFDQEEDIFLRETDPAEIMKNVMTTDEDTLTFHRPDGTYAGFVFLVYGNDGYDAISDHTATDEISAILSPAELYATEAEHKEAMDDWNYVGSRHHY